MRRFIHPIPTRIEGVTSRQARAQSMAARAELESWRKQYVARRDGGDLKDARPTVLERIRNIAERAGIPPHELESISVLEFARRVAQANDAEVCMAEGARVSR